MLPGAWHSCRPSEVHTKRSRDPITGAHPRLLVQSFSSASCRAYSEFAENVCWTSYRFLLRASLYGPGPDWTSLAYCIGVA
jgi:hypothetical protein